MWTGGAPKTSGGAHEKKGPYIRTSFTTNRARGANITPVLDCTEVYSRRPTLSSKQRATSNPETKIGKKELWGNVLIKR